MSSSHSLLPALAILQSVTDRLLSSYVAVASRIKASAKTDGGAVGDSAAADHVGMTDQQLRRQWMGRRLRFVGGELSLLFTSLVQRFPPLSSVVAGHARRSVAHAQTLLRSQMSGPATTNAHVSTGAESATPHPSAEEPSEVSSAVSVAEQRTRFSETMLRLLTSVARVLEQVQVPTTNPFAEAEALVPEDSPPLRSGSVCSAPLPALRLFCQHTDQLRASGILSRESLPVCMELVLKCAPYRSGFISLGSSAQSQLLEICQWLSTALHSTASHQLGQTSQLLPLASRSLEWIRVSLTFAPLSSSASPSPAVVSVVAGATRQLFRLFYALAPFRHSSLTHYARALGGLNDLLEVLQQPALGVATAGADESASAACAHLRAVLRKVREQRSGKLRSTLRAVRSALKCGEDSVEDDKFAQAALQEARATALQELLLDGS